MISIIIPHHLEDKEKIKPLMTSIDQQIGIDFNSIEIILSCDLDESPLDTYDFKEYTNISNRIVKIKSPYRQSPGMSRQCGLDICKGEYVMFCDADDSLYNLGVLRELLENINHSHADIYRFKFLEEIGKHGSSEKVYKTKEHNWTWVFSQAYRVEFLRKNNIRFSPTLRWHEDSYFNLILRYCNPKAIDIDSIAYLWKYSDTSITRIDDHSYTFLSSDEFLESISQGFRVIMDVYKKDCTFDIITGAVRGYMWLRNKEFLEKFNQDDIDRIEQRYYQYVKEFLPNAFFDKLPEDIEQIFTRIYFNIGTFIPDMDWHSFLLYLENKFGSISDHHA